MQKEDINSPASSDELITAGALLCNLLLDFSPCKWKLIEGKVLDMLKTWCRNEADLNVRRNGVWGFFNATFKVGYQLL